MRENATATDSQQFSFLLEEGETLKHRGQLRAVAAEDPAWTARCDIAIRRLAATGFEFTAEDIREIVADPSRPNVLGSRFSAAARAGVIKRVRFETADRASRHAGVLSVWVGRDA